MRIMRTLEASHVIEILHEVHFFSTYTSFSLFDSIKTGPGRFKGKTLCVAIHNRSERLLIEPMTPVSRQEHHQCNATPVIASSRKDYPRPILTRRLSLYAQCPQVPLRKHSETVIVPLIQTGDLIAGFGAEMSGNSGLGVPSSSRGGAGGALGGGVLNFEVE